MLNIAVFGNLTNAQARTATTFQPITPNIRLTQAFTIMAIPPHLLKKISESHAASDEQKQCARKDSEHAETKMNDRFRWSQQPAVPVELLEKLIDGRHWGATCSGDVHKQVREALDTNKKRWPGPARSIKVGDDVKRALDANPDLVPESGEGGSEEGQTSTAKEEEK